MENKQFVTHKDPNNKYGALITYGTREKEYPPGTIVSITLGDRFSVWKTIVNGIVSQFVMKQMAKSPGILYAEFKGDLIKGFGSTMTVWQGNKMAAFRDKGAHKFAMRFFSWVFYSGKSRAYFLTYKSNGYIPTADEAIQLVTEYGRFHDGGKLVREARKPNLDNIGITRIDPNETVLY